MLAYLNVRPTKTRWGKINMLTILQYLSECEIRTVKLESLFGAFLNVPGGKSLVVVNSALGTVEQLLVKEWLLSSVVKSLPPNDIRWSLPVQIYCHSLPLPQLRQYIATKLKPPL